MKPMLFESKTSRCGQQQGVQVNPVKHPIKEINYGQYR